MMPKEAHNKAAGMYPDYGSVKVSVMIFTLNEEVNLPGCLASLGWCDDVIVIDSFSIDRTEELCTASGVRFFRHEFEGFGSQRNWAIENTDPKNDWILILDADERVPYELAKEIAELAVESPVNVAACRIKRRFYMWGRWLRHSSLYPTWVVRLIHRDRVRYINRGHAETQDVHGEIRKLHNDLIDENLKGMDAWFERQNRYSTKEAQYELSLETTPLTISNLFTNDPLVRRSAMKQLAMNIPGRAIWYFFHSYLFRKGFLDGKAGLLFCIMKSMYQQMIVTKKYEMRRKALP